MDLMGNRRKRQQTLLTTNNLKLLYPHEMQLYQIPPDTNIELPEFEELALERLQMLRILEQATQKGHKLYTTEWKECVYNDLNKQNLKRFYRLAKSSGVENPTESDLQARRADHISHFILRLAYCRSDELRRWFLYRELEWFKLRFSGLTAKSVKQFLALNNLTYVPISSEEKNRLHDQLFQSTVALYVVDSVDFFKVSYREVPSLFQSRKVFLEKGFAYIPSYELVTCVLKIFRTHLNKALSYANRRLPLMDDERINLLIGNLHQIYTGQDYSKQGDGKSIDVAHIDVYSKRHYPLCMRHIHDVLRSTHEMKHGCRLQYGLFLKSIGLTFDESMAFWREEFTKRIDNQRFEKQYAYNIKHMYGKVGNMTSYSSQSCIKIISSNVGPGEHHGCPFKHWDTSTLKAKLTERGIHSEGIQEIIDKVSNGHYQVACSKYFEHTHAQPSQSIINHPNQYFEESFDTNEENKSDKKKEPKIIHKENVSNSTKVDDIDWDEDMI